MRRFPHYFMLLIGLFAFFSCSTEDVESTIETPSESNLYPLKDIAFAEYLIHNTTLAATSQNLLPYGICIARNDSFLLDTNKAKEVKALYLVKDATRIAELEAAGVASAAVKISNLAGIEFFTECTNLRLTSNSVEGTLDLSALAKLDTLEMNANLVSELIVPASIKRLRYSASSGASASQRLTAIDLSQNTRAEHIYVINHLITQEGLKLPATYPNLIQLDLSGNTGADFTIPQAMYDQLTTKKGVIPEEEENGGGEGETPSDKEYLVKDAAFADYLFYLMNDETDAALKLPADVVVRKENEVYINVEIAATYTGMLNISKAKSFIEKLTAVGVTTADVKIEDADGLQLFTGVTELTATSNTFKQPLPLQTLTELTSLIVRTAGVAELDLSGNTKLTNLDIQGSTSSSLGRLKAVDLSKNTLLSTVNLSANEIVPANFILPTSYGNLKTLNMGKNKVDGAEVTYTVPAALYDQLGSDSNDKAGLVRGE